MGGGTEAPQDVSAADGWGLVVRGALALAAAMGIGRFVYTPILPLMQAQAGMSAQLGGTLASANYLGYLVGAVAASLLPGLARSMLALRASLVVLIATLAAMPASTSAALWLGLRAVAGVASAVVFVVASTAVLGRLGARTGRRVGWVYSGVGAGIAASGLLVLTLPHWAVAWWASALLAVPLAVVAWRLPPPDPPAVVTGARPPARAGGRFVALLVSYTLEGAGYIIAGTFLVAAVDRDGPGWLGGSAWVLVGVTAVPSCALWIAVRRWRRPTLLLVALVAQAVGIALPALSGGVAAAVAGAVVFGATFVGVTALALAAGADLGARRSAALLTAGYAAGQVLGPVAVTPLLGHGYRAALLVAAALVLLSAAVATIAALARPH